jgi:hypothetical protein
MPIITTTTARTRMLVHKSGFLNKDVGEDMLKVMNEHRVGHDSRINLLNISLNMLSDDMDNKMSIHEALAGRTSLTKHMTASHQRLVRLLTEVQDDIMSEVNGTRTIFEGYIEEFVNGLKGLARQVYDSNTAKAILTIVTAIVLLFAAKNLMHCMQICKINRTLNRLNFIVANLAGQYERFSDNAATMSDLVSSGQDSAKQGQINRECIKGLSVHQRSLFNRVKQAELCQDEQSSHANFIEGKRTAEVERNAKVQERIYARVSAAAKAKLPFFPLTPIRPYG